MATFTLGTASQATGCAKSTILRAIRAGRISASRDELQQWRIDPASCSPPSPRSLFLAQRPRRRK
jgi:GH24 family phage-related lysozyme (muramidase)